MNTKNINNLFKVINHNKTNIIFNQIHLKIIFNDNRIFNSYIQFIKLYKKDNNNYIYFRINIKKYVYNMNNIKIIEFN